MAEDRGAFTAGVIEGFYGKPWSVEERLELFDWMRDWKFGAYLYAPKDDLKHRSLWREPYSVVEFAGMKNLAASAHQQGLRFIYGIAPGLDICYSDPAETLRIQARVEQMLEAGADGFAILFDDIPDRLEERDAKQFGSFASAQCSITNALQEWLQKRGVPLPLYFCPTAYCGRMAAAGMGGENYLQIIGGGLAPAIRVFWTGPEIISRQIPLEHLRTVQSWLQRKPVLWDNLHANDYDARRFYCGPYCGRPAQIIDEVAGIFSNPNCEFPLNFVPIRTLGMFLSDSAAYKEREAWLAAMREWLPRFRTVRGESDFDLLILFADCFYLPHEDGESAARFYMLAQSAVLRPEGAAGGEFEATAVRLRDFCSALAELEDRPLFYALSRRAWELREEIDLLERYVRFKRTRPSPGHHLTSDFHLPGTWRGGFIARLQRLLQQNPDGTFSPNAGL